MAAPYILAKTMQDAHTFARETLCLGKGHYRVVTSPSSISGRRGTKLYLVPGYEKRADRFAMAGALKYTRLEKIDGSALQAEAPDTRGYLTDRQIETAYRYNRLRETPDGLEPAGVQTALLADFEAFLDATAPNSLDEQVANDEIALALTPAEVVQVEETLAEEPLKQTRRRRCKECGALVEPDDLEQHMADHLPTEE